MSKAAKIAHDIGNLVMSYGGTSVHVEFAGVSLPESIWRELRMDIQRDTNTYFTPKDAPGVMASREYFIYGGIKFFRGVTDAEIRGFAQERAGL